MGLRWYVLLTEPRAEYLAAGELSKDELEVFFPRVKSTHQRLGHVDEPLFPGYLFLRLDDDRGSWPSFRPSHHVVGWVKFGGTVPSIPDEAITELAKRVEAVNSGQRQWRRFRPGELVRVLSGNIDDVGEVLEEAKSPQGRAKVLMEFMGRMVPVQVPWGDIRLVEDQPNDWTHAPRRTRGGGRWIRGFGPPARARSKP